MPAYAGFDTDIYSGDATMAWLKANSNLVWCGYYLAPAPSHKNMAWMGKRASLSGAGWGIAPVFVGQQTAAPNCSLNPSAATGVTDGQSAVQRMQSEGFALGSYAYLDLEDGPPMASSQQDYVASWYDTVTQAGYGAGIYCSHLLAAQVNTLRPGARIWAYKLTNQPTPVPNPFPALPPAGCGYPAAFAWQLAQNCTITVNSSSLLVDLDSAIAVDPSAPD